MLDNTSYINASLQMQFFSDVDRTMWFFPFLGWAFGWIGGVGTGGAGQESAGNWWHRGCPSAQCAFKPITQETCWFVSCCSVHINIIVTQIFFISHKLLSKFTYETIHVKLDLKVDYTSRRCLESFPCGNPYNHFPLFLQPKKREKRRMRMTWRTQGMGHVNLPNLPDSRCSSWLAWAGKPEKLQRVNTTKQFLRYLLQSGKNNLQWKWIWSRLIWQ